MRKLAAAAVVLGSIHTVVAEEQCGGNAAWGGLTIINNCAQPAVISPMVDPANLEANPPAQVPQPTTIPTGGGKAFWPWYGLVAGGYVLKAQPPGADTVLQLESTVVTNDKGGSVVYWDVSSVNGNPWAGNWGIDAVHCTDVPLNSYTCSEDDNTAMKSCPLSANINFYLCHRDQTRMNMTWLPGSCENAQVCPCPDRTCPVPWFDQGLPGPLGGTVSSAKGPVPGQSGALPLAANSAGNAASATMPTSTVSPVVGVPSSAANAAATTTSAVPAAATSSNSALPQTSSSWGDKVFASGGPAGHSDGPTGGFNYPSLPAFTPDQNYHAFQGSPQASGQGSPQGSQPGQAYQPGGFVRTRMHTEIVVETRLVATETVYIDMKKRRRDAALHHHTHHHRG